MTELAAIVLAWLLTAFSCVAIGRLVLKLTAPEDIAEETPVCFVVGAAGLSLLMFALCSLRLVHMPVLVGLACGVLVTGWRLGWRRLRWWLGPQLPKPLKWTTGVVGLAFCLLYLSQALGPEMSPDGSTYHLGLVGRYWREHGFTRITTHMYANLSQGVELVYLFAYAFGRHSAAAMVHFTFLLATVGTMLAYGRRFGLGPVAVAGAILFFASPVTGMDATTAYNDVAVAAILFVLFYLVEAWRSEASGKLLVPVGILAGYAYAAKYTAFLALPYALATVGFVELRRKQRWLRSVLIVAVVASLWVVPWLVKNWIVVHNPFSPFFNRWFRNPYTHVSFEDHYRWQMRNYPGLRSHWEIPLEVTVRGTVLCGLIGPVFLLAPVAGMSLRYAHGRRLLLAAAIFGSTYATNIGTRFLIPALPFLSLAMVLGLAAWRGWLPWLVAGVHAVLSWPPVTALYCDPHAWRLRRVAWKEALRLRPSEETLRAGLPGYSMARLIEEKVPAGERILTFNQIPEAYTTREILVVYQSALGDVLGDVLWMPMIYDAQPVRRIEFRFPATQAQGLRVVQTADRSPNHWSVAELRVYRGDGELARNARWRVRAWPNPWDVQRAFDNSPVTRWRSWERLFPGMFLEVQFGEPTHLDKVVLECAADQPDIRLQLQLDAGNGQWRAVDAQVRDYRVLPPKWMRRLATLELRRSGINYFLVSPGEFGRDDYEQNRGAWGIRLVGEADGIRLYRIE